MLTGHGRLDDALLQRPSILTRGPGPEILKAKPPGQFPAGVVPLPAPFALVVIAGVVPQPTHQPPRLGKLVPHPGRQNGIAPRHRQPRQRVGQLPRTLPGVLHRRQGLRPARRPGETALNGPIRLPIGRSRRAAQVGKAPVEPDVVVRASQPVPGREQVRIRLPERPLLVVEHLQRQPGVQLGIVPASPLQRTVLIVLHQIVVRIAGEGQGIEPERVHRRQVQQSQARVGGPQVGQVEIDQVVAQHEVRAVGQLVQPGQRLAQVPAHPRDGQPFDPYPASRRPGRESGYPPCRPPGPATGSAPGRPQRRPTREPHRSAEVSRSRWPCRPAGPAVWRRHLQPWLPSRNQAMPSTASKCRSADTRSAPVSMA